MVIRVNKEVKSILASYVRAAIAAGLAVYAAGGRDAQAILSAAVSAVLPPLLRWLNKNDTAFGRGAE